MRSFQYKILHNILFLSKKLYHSGITKSALSSYCITNYETPIHLFSSCNSNKSLWLQLNRHFYSDLTFPELTCETAILGKFNVCESNIHPLNHILFLFKLYIYKSRNKHGLNIHELLANILNIENVTAFGNVKKVPAYNKRMEYYKQKTSVLESG